MPDRLVLSLRTVPGRDEKPSAVLHASPEGAAGGVLALVENGDEIELDVARRRLELLVSKKELVKCKYVQGPASHMHFSTDGLVRAVSAV